ncbi:MAG: tetratricopeptide repeat protein [Candidatus Sumerlaeaceae bacterium]|nr:tetratricopeptide repeat protein [Candidatus Sumerlaeaceae bacterium]
MGNHQLPQGQNVAEIIERIRKNPFDEQAYYLLGREYLAQGANLSAAAEFRRAVELNPEFIEAWQGLAQAYRQAGVEKEARLAEQQVLQLSSTKWL